MFWIMGLFAIICCIMAGLLAMFCIICCIMAGLLAKFCIICWTMGFWSMPWIIWGFMPPGPPRPPIPPMPPMPPMPAIPPMPPKPVPAAGAAAGNAPAAGVEAAAGDAAGAPELGADLTTCMTLPFSTLLASRVSVSFRILPLKMIFICSGSMLHLSFANSFTSAMVREGPRSRENVVPPDPETLKLTLIAIAAALSNSRFAV
mmetsp:Transcript_12417/g.34867  ORF Transcript_12417/g.34867 Transcript_12417/m.34867 type:complete len:203 (+) Transcript_12417:193-801(+)